MRVIRDNRVKATLFATKRNRLINIIIMITPLFNVLTPMTGQRYDQTENRVSFQIMKHTDKNLISYLKFLSNYSYSYYTIVRCK